MRDATVGVRAAVVALGLVALWLGATPALIAVTRVVAHEKGVEFDAKSAEFGVGGIVFRGALLRPLASTGLEVHVGEAAIPWYLLRRASPYGARLAQVAVSGSQAAWKAWLDTRNRGERSAAPPVISSEDRALVLEDLRWNGADSERLVLAWAEVRRRGVIETRARGLAIELAELRGQISELQLTLSSNFLEVLGFEASEAILVVGSHAALGGEPPIKSGATDEQGALNSSPVAVTSGTGEGGAPRGHSLPGAPVAAMSAAPMGNGALALDPTRPERVSHLMVGLAEKLRRLKPTGPFVVKRFQVVLVRAGERLEFGPGLLQVARDAERIEVRFAAGERSGARPFQLTAKLPMVAAPIGVELVADGLHLSELGVKEGNFGLSGVATTALRVSGSAELDAANDVARFDVTGAVNRLNLQHARLAPLPLAGMNLSWTLTGEVALSGSSLRITRGRLGLGAVQSELQGTLRRGASRLEVDAEFKVPRASCQAMFDSLPEAAVPLLAGSRLRGQFSWLASVALNSDHISDARVVWRMQNGCRFERVPKEADTKQFHLPFTREVPGIGTELIQVTSGPGSDDWVPLSEMAAALEGAVLTTEDGGFWSHGGFQQQAIAEAIKQNLVAGKFQRGASTISMQLAKNLYLTREKYLARKVQEALLTMLLEQDLRKDELLELYFNVIEYGSGVYGIGPAAQHYFSVTPAQLTTLQAFFLASVLPNPHAAHFDEKGNLSSKWQAHLQHLIRIAVRRGRISSEEGEAALSERLKLGEPGASAGLGDTEDVEFNSPHD